MSILGQNILITIIAGAILNIGTKIPISSYTQAHPNSIYVNISPYPDLVPALSSNYEKYVRSEPNDTPSDNLLRLPRS